MSSSTALLAGIEGGGTKFVCAIGTSDGDILAETRFPTTSPAETLAQAVDFIKEQVQSLGPLAAIGIASFGPLDPQPASARYGHILATPKPGWTDADIVGSFRTAFAVPIGFDTDVNGAALSEYRWGAGAGCDPLLYLTVGTGIGGGALVNGKLLHGFLHPEMGHLPLPHDWAKDPFEGVCPFHGDCFEGLASGVAMEKRWGRRADQLPDDHPAWELEAHYIALALASYIYILSPQRIIIGGGVGSRQNLLSLIRTKAQNILNGYVQSPNVIQDIDAYIVHPGLGDRAGVLGAIALAEQMLPSTR